MRDTSKPPVTPWNVAGTLFLLLLIALAWLCAGLF
jgi:hypothetical protein